MISCNRSFNEPIYDKSKAYNTSNSSCSKLGGGKMIYLNAFIFCGLVCAIGQILLDSTNLTPGHITVIFVIIGTFLDVFNIYDKIVLWAGGGALVPITSFGHMLTHGAITGYNEGGILGLFTGTLNLTSAGISAAIIFAFFLSLIFEPQN